MSPENLPKTRAEAKHLGITQYLGKPCKYGHHIGRWTANFNCIECQRERDISNAESKSLYRRLYYLLNKDKENARNNKWWSEHLEHTSQQKKEYYQNTKEKKHAYYEGYYATPEGKAVFIAADQRRRARKAEVPGSHTIDELKKILERSVKCYLCGKKFTKSDPAEVEHVIALSHELGTNDAGNLAIAHRSCNRAKLKSRFNPITGQGLLL